MSRIFYPKLRWFKKKISNYRLNIYHENEENRERERLRNLAKDMETTEAQIQLANKDTKRFESVVEEETDGEDK